IFVSSQSRFPRNKWQNTIGLPIMIPAFGAVAGATPEVEGFDFSYPDRSSPLRKASVSVAGDGVILVSMMIREPAGSSETLMGRVCERVTNYASLFATRTAPEESRLRSTEEVKD